MTGTGEEKRMDDLLRYGRQKTVVVTGADRGLGYELVRQYLERGDRVFAGKYRTNWHLLEGLKERWISCRWMCAARRACAGRRS